MLLIPEDKFLENDMSNDYEPIDLDDLFEWAALVTPSRYPPRILWSSPLVSTDLINLHNGSVCTLFLLFIELFRIVSFVSVLPLNVFLLATLLQVHCLFNIMDYLIIIIWFFLS